MKFKNTTLGKNITIIALLLFVFSLSGCGAVNTLVKKRNLDVQTKMSETVFLEPSKPSDRVIFISIKNTSDKKLTIKAPILSALTESGFKVTKDPSKAKYMLQANVLQCKKMDLRSAENVLNAGFGGAAVGIAAASATGSRSGRSAAGAGLFGAMAGIVGDALVDDTLYAMITDLQIRERPQKGEKIEQFTNTNASQGTSTQMSQKVSGGNANWKTYRTRIMSTANKANLKFEEAKTELENGLIRSVSGIFSE